MCPHAARKGVEERHTVFDKNKRNLSQGAQACARAHTGTHPAMREHVRPRTYARTRARTLFCFGKHSLKIRSSLQSPPPRNQDAGTCASRFSLPVALRLTKKLLARTCDESMHRYGRHRFRSGSWIRDGMANLQGATIEGQRPFRCLSPQCCSRNI